MKELINQISKHKQGRNKMAVKIGKNKFGGDFVKRKYWKLKDGESVYRILPSLGFNGKDADGKWSHFYNVHYGYKNSKGEMRVFQSSLVKNRKTKMVEVGDAALERIEKLKAELEKAKTAGNKPLVDKLMDLVGSQKAQYNLDNNHYVNAMDTQGNIGILKLRHRAKLALDATIKALRDSGIEPLDAETGRFFVFRRSGMGLDTSFQVTVLKKKFRVEGVGEVEQDVVHVLTDDILVRLEKEAAELDNLYKRPTAEEVKRIVDESDLMTGKSRAVDEILDATRNPNTNDDGHDDDDQGDDAPSTQSAAPAATPAAAPTTQAAAAPVTQAAASTPAAVPAAQAAPTTQTQSLSTPTSSPASQTTARQVSAMSDEEFLKSLGM